MSTAPALILGTRRDDHSPALWQPDLTPHLLIASGRHDHNATAVSEATTALCHNASTADWDVSVLDPHQTQLAGYPPEVADETRAYPESPATPHALLTTLEHQLRSRYRSVESDGAQTRDFAPHILVISDIAGTLTILDATASHVRNPTEPLWTLVRCGRGVRIHVVLSGRADHFQSPWIPGDARANIRARWLIGNADTYQSQALFEGQTPATHQGTASSIADLGDGPRALTR